jgi:hypothetical protein
MLLHIGCSLSFYLTISLSSNELIGIHFPRRPLRNVDVLVAVNTNIVGVHKYFFSLVECVQFPIYINGFSAPEIRNHFIIPVKYGDETSSLFADLRRAKHGSIEVLVSDHRPAYTGAGNADDVLQLALHVVAFETVPRAVGDQ